MQALILATDEAPPGGGSKLHPLTAPMANGAQLPSPLLPVLNRPIMAYALEQLVRAGVRDIGVALYNRAGPIEAHFGAGTGSAAQLTYLLQREPLGSAGSLRWAASGLKEAVPGQGIVVLPGDALVEFDVCAALAFHQSHGGIATVIAHEPVSGQPFDAVEVGPGGRITGLTDSVSSGARILADTGAYIFDPRIFDWIPPERGFRTRRALDCHDDLLPELLGREAVHAYVTDGYWNPINSVPAYQRAQLDALASAVRGLQKSSFSEKPDTSSTGEGRAVRYLSAQDRELAPGILAGRHVSVHSSVRLVPPVYIGAGAQIERDVELGPNAVIGANTVVDDGATVRNSSVLEGTYVGRLVKVDGRVVRGGLIVDAGSGESLRVVDPFLLGEVSPRLIVNLLSRVADCAGALFLLLLSLPVLVLIALALLLASLVAGSPGRVLELRPRVRWRRTTESDVPERQTYGVAYFHTRREDRALRRQVPLPLGSFLERTGLQRLPALFSVLTGQLRLVGVKPLDPSEADQLVEEWQRLPYETPPGFTGLWYVSVLHRQGPQQSTHSAQLADLEKLDEIVAADAYYTATRSLLEDLHLLLSTPVAWVRGLIGSGPNTADRGWTAWRPRRQRRSFSGSLASAAEVGKD